MAVTPSLAPLSVSHSEWQTWSNLPWLAHTAPGSAEIQLCLRLVESAGERENCSGLFRQELPELASEFSAQWVAIVHRGAEWERIAEFGRLPLEVLPHRFLAESLDRDAAGCISVDAATSGSGWMICAAPLQRGGQTAELLVVCGRGLGPKALAKVLAAARGLGWSIDVIRRREILSQRIDRLRTTLRIASQLGSARETKPLLEMIAAEAA